MILNDRRKKRMRPLHSDLFSFEIELSSQTEKKIVHTHTPEAERGREGENKRNSVLFRLGCVATLNCCSN